MSLGRGTIQRSHPEVEPQAMNEDEAMGMKATLESKGEVEFEVCTLKKTVTIKKNLVSISKETKREHVRTFTPSVIEPSFGIGRIMYCLYEHSFYMRPNKEGDEQLNVFRFPPLVAPIKCTVFPLVQNQQYEDVAERISRSLTAADISNMKDITGTSIGKKYARTDELGVPFAITVDSTTSVTIRERDSKDQIRVKVDKVAAVVKDLCEGQTTWADMLQQKFDAESSKGAEESTIDDCMILLNAIPDVSTTSYTSALTRFLDAGWRSMFLLMPDARRKAWLETLKD